MLMLRDEQEKCCESKQARQQSGRDCALSPRPESLLTAALHVLLRSAVVVHGGTLFFAVFFGSSIIRLYGNTCGLDPLRPSTWTRAFMVMGSPWCRSLHWLACSATYVVDHMWCVCVVVQHRTISWSSHPLTTLLTPPTTPQDASDGNHGEWLLESFGTCRGALESVECPHLPLTLATAPTAKECSAPKRLSHLTALSILPCLKI